MRPDELADVDHPPDRHDVPDTRVDRREEVLDHARLVAHPLVVRVQQRRAQQVQQVEPVLVPEVPEERQRHEERVGVDDQEVAVLLERPVHHQVEQPGEVLVLELAPRRGEQRGGEPAVPDADGERRLEPLRLRQDGAERVEQRAGDGYPLALVRERQGAARDERPEAPPVGLERERVRLRRRGDAPDGVQQRDEGLAALRLRGAHEGVRRGEVDEAGEQAAELRLGRREYGVAEQAAQHDERLRPAVRHLEQREEQPPEPAGGEQRDRGGFVVHGAGKQVDGTVEQKEEGLGVLPAELVVPCLAPSHEREDLRQGGDKLRRPPRPLLRRQRSGDAALLAGAVDAEG